MKNKSSLYQQLLYSIKQTGRAMKPKKKSSAGQKKTVKKLLPTKPLIVIDKTVATTKERTHNTIEDPVQIKDCKVHPRSVRNHPSRLSCLQKLEECNLSPFSSPGGNSFSPRLKKTLSPSFHEQKEKKKCKGKNSQPQEKCQERKKSETEKRDHKLKPKMTKEQCNYAYQNLLLKKLKEKKITEQSHESESSAIKFKKLNLNIHIPKQAKLGQPNKINEQRIKELKKKIYQKYQKELPSFKVQQMKFFCSIVLIQRLFRQRRIKKFISDFISPRSNQICSLTGQFSKEAQQTCRLDITATTEEQTCELIKKYHNLSFEKKKTIKEQEIHSTEINSPDKKVNLKDLELSEELSPHNETKMINFVECLRDITFFRPPKNKGKTKSKVNVFNLQESLSEKCLMQSFYEKVFKASPSKKNNFDLFKLKQEEKKLERSIELINVLTPEKEVVIIDQRCQTQMQSNDHIQVKPLAIQKVDMSVQTDKTEPQPQNKEINSIKQLHSISESVILILLHEFSDEFHSFTARSILKKKKKSTLPGLQASEKTIRQYLSGLAGYMMKHYEVQVVRRFSLINPMSFLKIHHEYDDDEYYEEEEDQMSLPIVPNTLFYEYQQIYETEKFIVPESEKKFANFLEGLIKIHNLLLANCLSELLEKSRIDRIILPWDDKLDFRRNKSKVYSRKNIESIIETIISQITSCAFMKVGQFHKRLEDYNQEDKLLKSISLEYKSEGSQWSAQYELLQLRMDLTKAVEEMILEEVMMELSVFI